ncbi:unnamed protein product [Pedinophyceae sp. YPF-701]|nr:unnamed protein product [Pedinophyceae sp. YPF-701]
MDPQDSERAQRAEKADAHAGPHRGAADPGDDATLQHPAAASSSRGATHGHLHDYRHHLDLPAIDERSGASPTHGLGDRAPSGPGSAVPQLQQILNMDTYSGSSSSSGAPQQRAAPSDTVSSIRREFERHHQHVHYHADVRGGEEWHAHAPAHLEPRSASGIISPGSTIGGRSFRRHPSGGLNVHSPLIDDAHHAGAPAPGRAPSGGFLRAHDGMPLQSRASVGMASAVSAGGLLSPRSTGVPGFDQSDLHRVSAHSIGHSSHVHTPRSESPGPVARPLAAPPADTAAGGFGPDGRRVPFRPQMDRWGSIVSSTGGEDSMGVVQQGAAVEVGEFLGHDSHSGGHSSARDAASQGTGTSSSAQEILYAADLLAKPFTPPPNMDLGAGRTPGSGESGTGESNTPQDDAVSRGRVGTGSIVSPPDSHPASRGRSPAAVPSRIPRAGADRPARPTARTPPRAQRPPRQPERRAAKPGVPQPHPRPASAPRGRDAPDGGSPGPEGTASPRKQVTKVEEFDLSQPQGRHTKNEVARRVEEQYEQALPFEPTFVARPRSPGAGKVPRSFYERLQEDQMKRERHRRKMLEEKAERERKEAERVAEEARRARAASRRKERPGRSGESGGSASEGARGGEEADSSAGVPRHERLYGMVEKRRANIEKKRAEVEKERMAEVTGRPQTNQIEPQKYVPPHERAAEVVRRRQAWLASQEEKRNSAFTFQPQILKKSQRIAEARDLRRDLEITHGIAASAPKRAGLLYGSASTGDLGRPPIASTATDAMPFGDEGCTFRPAINPNSRLIAELDPKRPASFLDRIERELRERRVRAAANARAHEDPELSFRPRTDGNAGRVLAASRTKAVHLQESHLEKVERLSYQDAQRREALQQTLAESYYSQYPFQPEISRAAATRKATPLEELVNNTRGKVKRDGERAKVEREEARACTFQPDTTKPTGTPRGESTALVVLDQDHVDERRVINRPPERLLEHIMRQKEDRERKLAMRRAELAEREADECTFAPEVGPPPPAEEGPVLVRGLAAFNERQLRAREFQRQREEYEKKVFWKEPKGSAGHTVPQPPHLATEERMRDKATSEGWEGRRAAAEAYERAREEALSGRPRTNYARQRKLLDRILGKADPSAPAQEDGSDSALVVVGGPSESEGPASGRYGAPSSEAASVQAAA